MIIDCDRVGNPTRILMRAPDNWHNHFRHRGDPRFVPTVGYIARQFARANAMGNTTPPILTAQQMVHYRDDILWAAEQAGFPDFQPLMVVMATPDTTPLQLQAAFDAGAYGVKIMPLHGTTNSSHGISDYNDCRFLEALRATCDMGCAALFHAEVPDPSIPPALRERSFLPILKRIRQAIPKLKICVEHISDADMVDWVRDQDDFVAATVTTHHMEVTEVEANEDPHLQCMPYPKTDFDVRAVQQAAMTHPRFFYGSDNAPHLRPAKERQVPPPASGVFTAPVELPAIVEIFQREGQLDKLEAFLSERGARWHGYPFNEGEIQLVRNPWIVPEVIDLGGGHQIIPYKHGQTLPWRLA